MNGRFFRMMVREEKGMNMKPYMLKCGLVLALTFAGFLYSHMRAKRIKPSPTTSPKGLRNSRNGSQANLGGGMRSRSSFCSVVSDGNTVDIQEETRITTEEKCITSVISNKQTADKDEFLEFSETVKEADYINGGNSFKKDVEEAPRSARAGSPTTAAAHDEHEQEIRQLRNMIRILQDRERSLEVQLLEYCGLREQEAAVMELQNRLKISSMEAKMFNMKVETLQCENRRLEAQVVDRARVLAELETARAKVKLLKKKIRYEAEQNRDQIMNLKQKVSKLQDQESKAAAASECDAREKLKRLKELESEAEELRKSNMSLQMENSDLARRLDSAQILANAVLEDPEADERKKESERLRQEKEELVKEMEQLKLDRCSDCEELVYLRWINACLRHELRHCLPPPGKTTARDLSKSLSPTSEKKAKQLILDYANADGISNHTYFDTDQWSSPQTSFITDSAEGEEYSPHENSTGEPNNKSRIFSKLMKLIRGKDSQNHHSISRSVSRDKSRSLDDSNSPHYRRSISGGYDAGTDGARTEYGTPSEAARTSLDYQKMSSLREEDRRNSDSVVLGSSKSFSPRDSKNQVDTFPDSPGKEKSNLTKYAEALKDSSAGSGDKRVIYRKSASYSSF